MLGAAAVSVAAPPHTTMPAPSAAAAEGSGLFEPQRGRELLTRYRHVYAGTGQWLRYTPSFEYSLSLTRRTRQKTSRKKKKKKKKLKNNETPVWFPENHSDQKHRDVEGGFALVGEPPVLQRHIKGSDSAEAQFSSKIATLKAIDRDNSSGAMDAQRAGASASSTTRVNASPDSENQSDFMLEFRDRSEPERIARGSARGVRRKTGTGSAEAATGVSSTRRSMNMLSRLSREAQTAMTETKKEMDTNHDDSVDDVWEDTSVQGRSEGNAEGTEPEEKPADTAPSEMDENRAKNTRGHKPHTGESALTGQPRATFSQGCAPSKPPRTKARKGFAPNNRLNQVTVRRTLISLDSSSAGSGSHTRPILPQPHRNSGSSARAPQPQVHPLTSAETTARQHRSGIGAPGAKDYLKLLTFRDGHLTWDSGGGGGGAVASRRVVPLSKLPGPSDRAVAAFHITPPGYDCRFAAARPLVLDETPDEIRQKAFRKCHEWLMKYT